VFLGRSELTNRPIDTDNFYRMAPTAQGTVRMQPDILIAEDNPINQLLVTRMLERRGYTYEVVPNGVALLNAYREHRPALILMDVQMPEMDGLTATREIRKIEAEGGPRTTIIAITARALEGDAQMCLDSGMDDYISKPVRLDTLSIKLAQWLPKEAA